MSIKLFSARNFVQHFGHALGLRLISCEGLKSPAIVSSVAQQVFKMGFLRTYSTL